MGTGRRGAAIGVGLIVTLVAAVASIGRLLLGTKNSVGQLVWAEDGLFPLCVRKAGLVECMADPFAGYLLGVPRVLAGITAATPLETWGWVSNVLAAVTWGLLSGLTAGWLVAQGFRVPVASVVGLLPVVIPLAGLEAADSVGSLYMPMLYTATVIAAVGWQSRAGTVIAALVAFLAALTIPTAIILIVPLVVSVAADRIQRRPALLVLGALIVGIVLQHAAVLTAPSGRNLAITPEAVGAWLKDLPTAILTLWPGLSFGQTTLFGFFTLPVVTWTGAALAVALVIAGIRGAFSVNAGTSLAGLLVVCGLAYSFVPTATGYASNRYFVLTVLGVAAAGFLLVERVATTKSMWILAGAGVLFALAWIPTFPASEWRATASPEWTSTIDRALAECTADPTAPARLEFSPNWPQEGVTELKPPTNQFAPCSALGFPLAR